MFLITTLSIPINANTMESVYRINILSIENNW